MSGTTGYADNGNITTKPDAGDYTYKQDKVHAVEKIENNTGTIPLVAQNITYNSFNKTKSITENGNSVYFVYGADQQRRIMKEYEDEELVKTTYYQSNYEETTDGSNVKKYHYISGINGLIAVLITTNNNDILYYITKDHLGSITALVDEDGNIAEEYGYDSWGRRRNPSDWTYTNVPTPTLLTRGYTGHEHLDKFGLINMNGRMYDAVIGRMLSPDNFVQDPFSTQFFNRYSYCGNNPLKYTDPDGEWIQFLLGGIMGGINGYMLADAKGLTGWDKFGYTLAGAGIGVATAGIGTWASSALGTGAAATIGSGSIAGGFNSLAFAQLSGNHKNEGLGFVTGGISGGLQGAIGGGGGAFAGGAAAGIAGSYFNGERDAGNLLVSGAIGGGFSFGAYHLSGAMQYAKYKNSGVTFDGHSLSYRQFMGMSADFQRSEFWEREFGGVLTESGGYVHSYAEHPFSNPSGATTLSWDINNLPADTWATYHTHYGEPGTLAPDGGIFTQYQSPTDYKFDMRWNISSITINKYDACFSSTIGHYSMPFSAPFYIKPSYLYYLGY